MQLGDSAHTLIMRNHGALTVGRTVGEAWVRYFYLDRICRVQEGPVQPSHAAPHLASLRLPRLAGGAAGTDATRTQPSSAQACFFAIQ